LTDLDAILRAVLADPADDTPRLVYAEICDDLAGVVACPAGCKPLSNGIYCVRASSRASMVARCPRCAGSGSVSNGLAERAEFVRVQCELARMPADEPFARVAEAVLAERLPRMSRLERNESRDILLPQCFPEARQRVADRDAKRKELRRRERELWESPRGVGTTIAAELGGTIPHPQTAAPEYECRVRSGGVDYVVRRGFVSEIRTGLSQFVGGGGECGRCGGNGLLERHRGPGPGGASPMYDDCIPCSGTGRVGLDLAAVFAVHPITRVATDREPTAASHQSGAWHWTWVGNDADSRVGLPRKLMAALSASGIARVFDSRDAAMDALSLACVNLGRAAAGLDPLT